MNSTIEINIRGYHLDVYGHVNNARYLEFLEEARWSMFEKFGLYEWSRKGLIFAVVNINISYKKAALLGEVLLIESGITKFGNKSCTINQKVIKKETGELASEADVTFVMVDANGKTLTFTDDIREKLSPLLAA